MRTRRQVQDRASEAAEPLLLLRKGGEDRQEVSEVQQPPAKGKMVTAKLFGM